MFAAYHEDKLTEVSGFSIHGWDHSGSRTLDTIHLPGDPHIDPGIDLDGDGIPDVPARDKQDDEFDPAPAGVAAGQTRTSGSILGHSNPQLHIEGEEDGCHFYLVFDIKITSKTDAQGTEVITSARATRSSTHSGASRFYPRTTFSALIHVAPRRFIDWDDVVQVYW